MVANPRVGRQNHLTHKGNYFQTLSMRNPFFATKLDLNVVFIWLSV